MEKIEAALDRIRDVLVGLIMALFMLGFVVGVCGMGMASADMRKFEATEAQTHALIKQAEIQRVTFCETHSDHALCHNEATK